MLLIDYTSAFNTIVPYKAHSPGSELLPMQLGPGLPDGTTTGGEGPLLYPLYTHNCMGSSNSIIKFAEETTVVGLIIDMKRQTTGRR
jgi:hypothetical protein